jgi:hypothetical protein
MAYLRGSKGTITGRTMDSPVFTNRANLNFPIGTPSAGVMTNMTGMVEASVTDNAITLAKMAGGTDGNIISYDGSGNPVAIATGSDGQLLTSTGAGSPPAFEAAPSGTAGISYASQWRLSANLVGSAEPITSNWEQHDAPVGFGVLGTSMSESSGIFTFPATGYWLIHTNWMFYIAASTDRHCGISTQTTTDNSTYAESSFGAQGIGVSASGTQYGSVGSKYVFDVTDTTTHKCSFTAATTSGSTISYGQSSQNRSSVTFIWLADT